MPKKYICPECNASFTLNDIEYKCSKHPWQKMESRLFDFIWGNTPSYCPKCKTKSDHILHDSSFCDGCSSDIVNPDVCKRRICIVCNSENIANSFKEKFINDIRKKFPDFSMQIMNEDSDDSIAPLPLYISYKDYNEQKLLIVYIIPTVFFESLQENINASKLWEQCFIKSDAVILLKDLSMEEQSFVNTTTYLARWVEKAKQYKNISEYPYVAEIQFGQGDNQLKNSMSQVARQFKIFSEEYNSIELLNWIIGEK